MLGMKNHFDKSGSIEIREVDIAGVACILFTLDITLFGYLTQIWAWSWSLGPQNSVTPEPIEVI